MPTRIARMAPGAKVVKAFNDNPTSGVVKIDGKMIDKPIVDRAKYVLQVARALKEAGV